MVELLGAVTRQVPISNDTRGGGGRGKANKPSLWKASGRYSAHDHAQGGTGLIRRCPNRSVRREGWLPSGRSHSTARHSGCPGSSFHKSPSVGFSISTHHRWMRISSIHSRRLRLTRGPLPQVRGRSRVRVHPILQPVLICCPRPKDGRRSAQC